MQQFQNPGLSNPSTSIKQAGFLIRVFAFVSLWTASSLWAFHPIRYSPLDLYVIRPKAGGPKSLAVYDKNDKKGKSEKLVYDAEGRLVKELFFDENGKAEGETRLTYRNNKLIKEELYDTKGKLLNKRVFEYTGRNLVKMRVYDSTGNLELEQIYRYRGNRLTGGQENNGVGLLSFDVSYTNGRVSAIRIRTEDKKVISKVYIKYNKEGRVLERVRSQEGKKHKFKYNYKNGKIDSYSLYVFTKGKWKKIKTIRFFY